MFLSGDSLLRIPQEGKAHLLAPEKACYNCQATLNRALPSRLFPVPSGPCHLFLLCFPLKCQFPTGRGKSDTQIQSQGPSHWTSYDLLWPSAPCPSPSHPVPAPGRSRGYLRRSALLGLLHSSDCRSPAWPQPSLNAFLEGLIGRMGLVCLCRGEERQKGRGLQARQHLTAEL